MIYLGLGLWLLILVGVLYLIRLLWSHVAGSVWARVLILPGILLRRLIRVFMLLVTGDSLSSVSLYDLEEGPEPGGSGKLSVAGTFLVSLAAVVGALLIVWWCSSALAVPVHSERNAAQTFPQSGPQFVEFLKGLVAVGADSAKFLWQADYSRWETFLFLYLAVSFTAGISPSTADLKRLVIGIVLVALVFFGVSFTAADPARTRFGSDLLHDVRRFLQFAVGVCVPVLFISIVVTVLARLVTMIVGGTGAPAAKPKEKKPPAKEKE
jgi:hypothetical protein